jgi:hypothetical protein
MKKVFNHLRGYIGARVWSPMGEAMLSCVADDYLTVVLTSDGGKMRYYDPTAVLLYVDSEASLKKSALLPSERAVQK